MTNTPRLTTAELDQIGLQTLLALRGQIEWTDELERQIEAGTRELDLRKQEETAARAALVEMAVRA
jgi:hypothetical protein